MSAGPRPRGTVTFDLFVDCVIPGCRNPVNRAGDVCQPCRVAFGPYLTIHAVRAPLTEAEIAERHRVARRVPAAKQPTQQPIPRSPGPARSVGCAGNAAPAPADYTGRNATAAKASPDHPVAGRARR